MSDTLNKFNRAVAELLKNKPAAEVAAALKGRGRPEVTAFDLEVAELLKNSSADELATILKGSQGGGLEWFDENNNNNKGGS